ncbi:MAG: hypothetical protein A2W35_18865 [Chloroflexi bacterium RBG_16_57_11]|nr:MAG: hypothetical protein A2W35_18865 [Chloroflexi bacterium RBG_16_57_11]
MPEVLVNGRYTHQPMIGVKRYAQEVAGRLGEPLRLVTPPGSYTGSLGHLWEQVGLPRQVGRDDLLWSPANTGPLSVASQVVTIHDLSSLEHPEWYDRRFAVWYRTLLPRLARRVHKIITPSRFTLERLATLLDIPEHKLIPIPEGVASHFRPAGEAEIAGVRSRYGLNAPYLLVVGSLEPRKNLPRLFQAWERIVEKEPGIELVLAGDRGPVFREAGYPRAAKGVRLLGRVDDAVLPALYSGAQATLAVSLYEGFGLPALEAMACGAPLIASKNTSIPEVVGEAALMVDPYEVEQIAEAMEKVLTDSACREGLRSKGLQRARLFSWEGTAQRTWEVLWQALLERGG